MVAFTPEKEKDIESVAQPDADERETIDDAIFAANYRAEERDYERLKSLENDGKIGVKGGEALSKAIEETPPDTKKGFFETVGNALSNFSDGMENRLNEVYEDKNKRAMFLSGLNTVIESSSYTPIGQAKSLVGKIATGQKKGFLESEAIGTKRAEIEAKKAKADKDAQFKLAELMQKSSDIEYKRSQPDSIETDYYKDLRKRNEDINKAVTNEKIFNQMKNITAQQIIESGELPVGKIYSAFPTSIQAIVDILPSGIKPDSAFFDKVKDEATYLQQMVKLVDNLVLGDIGQLVPVSDKDVEIKRNTYASVKDTPAAFVAAMITQDAINSLNAAKSKYQDIYIGNRDYSAKNKRKGFESQFETDGATIYKNEILNSSKYSEKEIMEQAAKLGYQQDYTKYTDSEQPNYSPFALAEAKASLDLGGIDRWSKVQSARAEGTDDKIEPPGISEDSISNEDQLKQDDIPFQLEEKELEGLDIN